MKFTKRKIVLSIGVIVGAILIFIVGFAAGAALIMNQSFNQHKANDGYMAFEKISVLTMLRDDETEEAIRTLDSSLSFDLLKSVSSHWEAGARDDMTKLPEHLLIPWQEASAYYEKYPEILQQEYDPHSTFSRVRELLGKFPKSGRKGTMRDFAKIYTGKTPPSLQISKWLGSPVTLEQLHGKVILLDFWGVWCGPCRYWLPHTQQLYDKYNKMGLEVVGIHSYKKSETADQFLTENNYTFLVGIDTGDTAHNYAVTAWPTYYLIDKKGHLVWGPEHKPPSDKQIESLLKD